MGVSRLFGRLELIQLGHAIVLIVFCAGGLGLIGYTKIAMSSPTVSVACSLASNVPDGEAGQSHEAGHMATVVTKCNNSTNS